MIRILDLHFQQEGTVASFLADTREGPVLIESGPHSTWPHLVEGLQHHGLKPSDIRHVLLSHIHFDHAGAAWALAEAGATVWVHPMGYPHLLSPERLYNSAQRIYGDQMERLWGRMEPIPAERLKAVGPGEILRFGDTEFTAHHSPGHAVHHIAWQCGNIIFTGDVAGVKIGRGPVVPPCPPPDIDIEAWQASIALLRSLNPAALYLTHYGPVFNVAEHLHALERILLDWAEWVRVKMAEGLDAAAMIPQFQAYTNAQLREAGLGDHELEQYEAANPAFMSVGGLMRYWSKKQG